MSFPFRRGEHGLPKTLLRAAPRSHATHSTISASLIHRVITRSLAVYCLIFGAQAIPDSLAGASTLSPIGAGIAATAVFSSLVTLIVTGLLDRGAAFAASMLSIVYVALIASWPLLVSDANTTSPTAPWPSPLSSIAFAAAAFAFPRRVALAYVGFVYVIYVLVRQTPAGGGASLLASLGEAGYGVILGGSVLLLIDMFRRAAAAVDAAHARAVNRYSRTVREHRTELERVQVDSILHDSVLTTFLTAARAHDMKEQHLAVAMARHALTEVASAGPLPERIDDPVALAQLRGQFETACAELGIDASFTTDGLVDYCIPGSVVETMFSAVMQALTNSVQHAGTGPVSRNVHISWRNSRLAVAVTDDGAGFDTTSMTPNRLGIRVSIIERMRNIGGRADIISAPERGTQVLLRWPADATETNEYPSSSGGSDRRANRSR